MGTECRSVALHLTRNLARILRCTLLTCPASGVAGDLVRYHLLIWPKSCCDGHQIKPFVVRLESGQAGGKPDCVSPSRACFRRWSPWRRHLVLVLATSGQDKTGRAGGIFWQQLSDDFQRTVERFLALQTMGTETARQDARALKKTVLALPMPEVDVLNGGLET